MDVKEKLQEVLLVQRELTFQCLLCTRNIRYFTYISSSDSNNSSERKVVLFCFAILQIKKLRFIGYVACLRFLAAGKL